MEMQTRPEKFSWAQTAVIENAKWVDAVLLSGFTVAVIVVLAKIIGANEIDLFNQKVPISKIWVAYSIFTLSHIYASWILIKAIVFLWDRSSDEECYQTYQEIITTGHLFVRGLSPRVNRNRTIWGITVYQMPLNDPASWASIFFAIMWILAIIPFDTTNPQIFWGLSLVAITFTAFNWIIGSYRILSLSELAISHNKSIILKSIVEKTEKRDGGKRISFYGLLQRYKLRRILKITGGSITTTSLSLAIAFIIVYGVLFGFFTSYGYGTDFLKVTLLIILGLFLFRISILVVLAKRFGKLLYIFVFLVISGTLVWLGLIWIK